MTPLRAGHGRGFLQGEGTGEAVSLHLRLEAVSLHLRLEAVSLHLRFIPEVAYIAAGRRGVGASGEGTTRPGAR